MNDGRPTLLIIQTRAPYASSAAQEALDLLLAAAAFDMPASYLLLGDACYQLMAKAQAARNGRKAVLKMMKALPLYGVEEILVERNAAEERGLSLTELEPPVRALSPTEIAELLRQARHVIRF
jgi:tRNA 2-thiouridine synthesizing protein C